MHLVGSTPFGSEATLDRAPWKGTDGGLRCLAFSAYNYSMTATIDSDTIQRSARAGTMVNGIFITLATRNTGCRWRIYNTVFHPIIPALCRISPDYSRIMPAPWTCLLCPKLCRHNSRIPTSDWRGPWN